MARKAAEEASLRAAIAADSELSAAYGNGWDLVDAAMATHRSIYHEYLFIEQGGGFYGDLFGYARALVRAAAEREVDNPDRLREYTETALPRLQMQVLAERPIDRDFEELGLAFSLEKMREWLGPDSPYVRKVLGNESPATLAERLVAGSKLDDPTVRKALWQGGVPAVRESDDPMIRLALAIDPDARALRQRYEDEVEAPRIRGEEMIADARFRAYGTDIYPDATFTLRVTYGAVAGWEEKGEMVDPLTRTSGALGPARSTLRRSASRAGTSGAAAEVAASAPGAPLISCRRGP